MKQKQEIAVQQEMLNQQRDKVNANHLELARQSNHVRANEKVIQSQKEKIEQQEKEFKENFISNSDRIMSQGELIEEQREELQQLTVRIGDVETLLDEVSSESQKINKLPFLDMSKITAKAIDKAEKGRGVYTLYMYRINKTVQRAR